MVIKKYKDQYQFFFLLKDEIISKIITQDYCMNHPSRQAVDHCAKCKKHLCNECIRVYKHAKNPATIIRSKLYAECKVQYKKTNSRENLFTCILQ